jgi:hypothetical protein
MQVRKMLTNELKNPWFQLLYSDGILRALSNSDLSESDEYYG